MTLSLALTAALSLSTLLAATRDHCGSELALRGWDAAYRTSILTTAEWIIGRSLSFLWTIIVIGEIHYRLTFLGLLRLRRGSHGQTGEVLILDLQGFLLAFILGEPVKFSGMLGLHIVSIIIVFKHSDTPSVSLRDCFFERHLLLLSSILLAALALLTNDWLLLSLRLYALLNHWSRAKGREIVVASHIDDILLSNSGS